MSTVVYAVSSNLIAPQTRQRDARRTREAILGAAVAAFASKGYGGVGVREIAAAAGVNSALVGRYFGSKEGLFEEALSRSLDLRPILETPRADFGKHVVRIFFETQDVPSPLAMMILSAADPTARDICARRMQSNVIDPLAAWLGPPDGQRRAIRLNLLWSGFLSGWRLVPLPALQDADALADARAWLEAATQAIVGGREP